MKIEYKIKNNANYLILKGEIDENTANQLRPQLDQFLLDNHFQHIVFDLSGVTFMDSTGIGLLIGRYKVAKNFAEHIFICNPNSHIDKLLNMSGIYQIMPKIKE